MNESLRSYYLSAMGVPEYLHAIAKSNDLIEKKISVRCLVVEQNSALSFCQPNQAQALLYKMLGAIELQADDIVCLDVDGQDVEQALDRFDAQAILLMDPELSLSYKHCFKTHHPSVILKDESLKRDAWEVLKQIKTCLK